MARDFYDQQVYLKMDHEKDPSPVILDQRCSQILHSGPGSEIVFLLCHFVCWAVVQKFLLSVQYKGNDVVPLSKKGRTVAGQPSQVPLAFLYKAPAVTYQPQPAKDTDNDSNSFIIIPFPGCESRVINFIQTTLIYRMQTITCFLNLQTHES